MSSSKTQTHTQSKEKKMSMKSIRERIFRRECGPLVARVSDPWFAKANYCCPEAEHKLRVEDFG